MFLIVCKINEWKYYIFSIAFIFLGTRPQKIDNKIIPNEWMNNSKNGWLKKELGTHEA